MNTPQSKSPIPNINSSKLINLSDSNSNSNSPAINDSPIFNYINNLSPIPPVKAEPGGQGFPGLASPPLLFTSPRVNSLQSLLNRKLLSAGSLESPQDKDKCHQNDGDPGKSAKIGPERNNPFISREQRPCSEKSVGQISHCSPGCIDDFLSDPDTNSLSKRQSDDASLSLGGGSLQKRDGSGENVSMYGSAPLKVRKGGHAKSRISIKVVKNEARHLISPSEGFCSVPRMLAERAFEICQNVDALNEASHLERGALRRCLFDENQKKSSNNSEFRNFSDNLKRMEELTNLSSSGTLGDSEKINNPKPRTDLCVSPVTGSYPVISRPLGIGLHLNSVVYPRPLDSSNGSHQSSQAELEGKDSVVLTGNRSDGNVTTTVIGNVSAVSEEGSQYKAYSSATPVEAKPSDIEHFYSPDLLRLDTPNASICLKRKISPLTAENNEVPNQMSPKKKRKKSSSNNDNDIPKRCNCKKTKCLKLYCDCFAAGMYCSESCACQGCCNRPDNVDTVQETRQQIESRNPLAFAPKVVKLVTDSPAINKEVKNLSTPSSARHKTGCNCKKSMCLKKYCECYQANVGCSEGCRCEGCKNVFGIREDYRIIAGSMVRNATDEISEAIVDRRHTSPKLTPPTPALQCSDSKKNALKSRLPSSRLMQTPDSQNDVSVSDENFLSCPENSQSYTMLLENSSEGVDESALYAEDIGDRLETTGDESTTTSALISNSVLTLMGPPSSSNTNDSRIKSQFRLQNESIVPPMTSSLRWRSSPVTPINHSAGLKFQDFGSGSKNSDTIDDETPDVLKDSSTTAKSVKVSSPNKKRVSAPQNPVDSSGSLKNDPTDSSGSLKVCHRFVLRALPTLPSLTPFPKKQQ